MENENKSVPASLRDAQANVMGAFNAFKDANDERLGAIERKVAGDILLEEKVDRIDRALSQAQSSLDRLALMNARPQIGAVSIETN